LGFLLALGLRASRPPLFLLPMAMTVRRSAGF
jgi:hypothetical protein